MNELPITEAVPVHTPVHTVEKHAMRVRDYVQVFVVTVLVALFLKTFIVEAYRIPSPSMEHTLRVGDFLLANKFIYGAQIPRHIPFTDYTLPRFRFPALTTPQHGDIVVFELPENAQEQNTTETTNFVKRCIGLPGDTIAILNKRVIINEEEFAAPESGSLTRRRVFPNNFGDSRIFPKGSQFNEDNYGPLAVPRRGDKLKLDAGSFMLAKDIVEHEGHTIRLDSNGMVLIDGVLRDSYEVEKNYFFMMGDNRDNSLDSRFWGFVADDLIIGKVMIIYWSWDEERIDDGVWSRLAHARWKRIGTIVH